MRRAWGGLIVLVLVILLLGFGAVGRSGAADTGVPSDRIVALEKTFMAPCCWSQTAHDHKSGAADKIRTQIRTWVDEGLSDEDIASRFVAEHGERILAMPRASGFNLAAYILPVVFPIAGGLVLLLYLRGRSGREVARAMGPAVALSVGDRAALERALAEKDR